MAKSYDLGLVGLKVIKALKMNDVEETCTKEEISPVTYLEIEKPLIIKKRLHAMQQEKML